MGSDEVRTPRGLLGRAGALLREPRSATAVLLVIAAWVWTSAVIVALDPETQSDARSVPVAVGFFGLGAVLTMLVWTLKHPSRRTVWPPERLPDELARLLVLAGCMVSYSFSVSHLSWVTWLPLVLIPVAGGSVTARICLSVVAALGGAEAETEEPDDDRPWREVRADRGWT